MHARSWRVRACVRALLLILLMLLLLLLRVLCRGVTVVTPNWIVDSCARGELLPVGEYLYSRLRGDAGDDGQQRQLSDWFRAPQPLPLVSASGPSAAASQHVDAGEATADPTRAGAASAIADAEGEEGEKSEANDADDLLAHAEEDDEHLRAMGEELNRLDPNNPRPFVQKCAGRARAVRVSVCVVDCARACRYYATSRLHFLSTWKLKFKALCQRLLEQRRADAVRAGAAGTSMGAAGLAASGDAAASAGGTLNTMDPSPTHVFIHFDIDAFFATVSLRDRPDLRGRPVVISHGSRADGSADVAACSYEARAFGTRAGVHTCARN